MTGSLALRFYVLCPSRKCFCVPCHAFLIRPIIAGGWYVPDSVLGLSLERLGFDTWQSGASVGALTTVLHSLPPTSTCEARITALRGGEVEKQRRWGQQRGLLACGRLRKSPCQREAARNRHRPHPGTTTHSWRTSRGSGSSRRWRGRCTPPSTHRSYAAVPPQK